MEIESAMNEIESGAYQVNGIVNRLLGDVLNSLDLYMEKVKASFINGNEILDADLSKIIVELPTRLYDLIMVAQQLEMKKGLAKEGVKIAENEALLVATGTVAEKQAKAENAAAKERVVQLAYTTACSIVSKKIDGVMAILDSAKKVQAQRMKEMSLTMQAGSSVAAF